MITATQAKNIAENVLSENDKAIMIRLDYLIRKAAEEGKSAICIGVDDMNPRVEKEVKKLGFNYRYYSDQRDGSSRTISW